MEDDLKGKLLKLDDTPRVAAELVASHNKNISQQK
jgi:hypothetical protein